MRQKVTALLASALLLSGCIDSGPYYKDCDAARSASAAPLKAGDPGYRSGLDRNRDGVACEED